MKKVFSAGETYWCIIHSRTDKSGNANLIYFWTGEGFMASNPRSHMEAKLFKTKEEADREAATVILSDPKRFMGWVEVTEQVCPRDVWK